MSKNPFHSGAPFTKASRRPAIRRHRDSHRRATRFETLETRAMLAAEISINFNEFEIASYGGSQDRQGDVAVEDGGTTLRMNGNRWKQIELPYKVTSDTVLEFDFQSSAEGEIHGIGFDNDLRPAQGSLFQLYGTQAWGRREFSNYGDNAPSSFHYRIPVGDFFTGDFEYLLFGNDHDVRSPSAESVFSNIRIYEDTDAEVLTPIANDDAYVIQQGSALTILDVLANDGSGLSDSSQLSLTEVNGTTNGSIAVVAGDQIIYSPASDFVGEETFVYTIDNGTPSGQASGEVRIRVLASDSSARPSTVLYVPGTLPLSGDRDDYLEIEHHDGLSLAEGTYVTSFLAEETGGRQAIFSKDAKYYGDGGHLIAFVENGRIKVRFQSDKADRWLTTPEGSIEAGQEYQLAITFGSDGVWLYLDGLMQDWHLDFVQTMELNRENLVIGASGWGRSEPDPDWNRDHFEGTISDFTLYDSQLSDAELQALAGIVPEPSAQALPLDLLDEVFEGLGAVD